MDEEELQAIYGSGVRLVVLSTLDTCTCLICLRAEGGPVPPTFPLHEGCRCIAVPTFPGDEVEVGSRVSDAGPIPASDRLYRSFLIERAQALAGGMSQPEFAPILWRWLAEEESQHDVAVVAAVRASIAAMYAPPDPAILRTALDGVAWTHSAVAILLSQCCELGLLDVMDRAVERLTQQVEAGTYAARHKTGIYRGAAAAVSSVDAQREASFLQRAHELDPDSRPIVIQLSKALRKAERFSEARLLLMEALASGTGHKGLSAELARVERESH